MKNTNVIKVGGNGKACYGIGSRISFSLLSSLKDGRKQILCFDTCRDYINDCLISFFNVTAGNVGSSHWKKGMVPVDTARLRLLIAKDLSMGETREDLHRKLRAAKNIINMYENIAGFKKRSVIKRVEHSNPNIKFCWVVISPPEWLKSSHLVSMITLIFRIVVESGGFEQLRNVKEVEQRFKELCEKNSGRYNDCGHYLTNSWERFRMLMEYYDDLFGSKTNAFWYPLRKVTSWHSCGGIVSLCRYETDVKDIDDLMRKAWEKWQKQ